MDKELKQFVTDIRKAFTDAEILLFGSRAKGTSRSDSDYDLIIVSKGFKSIPFVNRAYHVWIKSNANIAADLICYSPDEMHTLAKTSTITQDALKHAVAI